MSTRADLQAETERLWTENSKGHHSAVLAFLGAFAWEDKLINLLASSDERDRNTGISLANLILNSSLSDGQFPMVKACIDIIRQYSVDGKACNLDVHARRMLTAYVMGESYDERPAAKLLSYDEIVEKLS